MAKFDFLPLAPIGLNRDSPGILQSLTGEQQREVSQFLRVTFSDHPEQAFRVPVSIGDERGYELDINRVGETALIARWFHASSRDEPVTSALLLSGKNPDDDALAVTSVGNDLMRHDVLGAVVSETMVRIEEGGRPILGVVHLTERSFDSVTVNQFTIGLAHLFFDAQVH